MKTRKPLSEKTKIKISNSLKNHPIYKSKKRNAKISNSLSGRIISEEVRKKISKNNARYFLGKSMPIEVKSKISNSMGGKNNIYGTKHYRNIHYWIKKQLGNATGCKYCIKTKNEGFQIYWANISQEYKKDINDWITLCASCHQRYDMNFKRKIT